MSPKFHRQARNLYTCKDLPADDSERTCCSEGRMNMAKIDVKGTSVTVINPDFNPVEFDGFRMQAARRSGRAKRNPTYF